MKQKYEIVKSKLKELVKITNLVDEINENGKIKFKFILSGKTTLLLLGLSSEIFNNIWIDVEDKNSDIRKGKSLVKRFRKMGINNISIDKVQKAETLFKNTKLITNDEITGQILIPTYERLFVNLHKYGILPDEEDRISKRLAKKINYSKLEKIVKHNKLNKLPISEYARELLSKNLKPEKTPLTETEKEMIDKTIDSFKDNKNVLLYGGLAVEKQVNQNTRATFDIDLLSKPEEVEKVLKALKTGGIPFKDWYSENTSNLKVKKINGVAKTTITILNPNKEDKDLKIDLVHTNKNIINNKLLTVEHKNQIKMLNREALLCIKLNVVFENIEKNQVRSWDNKITKHLLDVLLLDWTDTINNDKIKKVYLELKKLNLINIDWSKRETLRNILDNDQRFENRMRNWIRTNEINPHFKKGNFETINKYITLLEKVKGKVQNKKLKVRNNG